MRKFETPTPITAVINVPAGRVQVIAADRNDTTVEVLPARSGRGRDVKAAEQTAVACGDGSLKVTTTLAGGQILGPSGSVEVTVQVPSGSNIEVESGGAEFRGVGRFGDLKVNGVAGAVKVDEAASVRLAVLGGDVTIGRLTGPAEISTHQGDVRIGEADSGSLVLSTQMGDVIVDAAPGVSATLDARTGLGRIHNALRNTEGATAALAIRATSGHGDITARSH
ncbi:DUF4097 family beta strand repeat-containing protein [Phytomonospora endophytica]|uniref:DUF4097 and DUF4098 domain-containing protein YvlB n=1 Tax=Phytomonospora endophytica TaxID=714109 RepID=A0A841FT83_9ACTN|nr:DUF4097 family beta strand repeat-containing protein [Phytomonospora endophytica]MBB6036752.1 DUF4097 and DUF4098 domain-containing protein YvlB [Phytomonospora endophytica]GIG68214.1 hypothetical protein Pen01_45090 [Phytomonospora endophytica]